MKTAQAMGITTYQGYPGYSLVLGGLGVRLIDHVSAFGTFANAGVHVPYYAIEKVIVARNHQTYVHPTTTGQQVISPQLAYMMTNVLSDNVSRIPEFADCNVLQLYSNSQQDCYYGNRGVVRPAAAKTGTTNDFRDNWTIGYTTDYVMGVWAGNDDNSPMYDVSGVQGAAPIWHDAMLVAEQGHPIRDFTNPGGLQWASLTYPDGVQTSDWFLPGTVPDFATSEPATPSSMTLTIGTVTPGPNPTPTPRRPPAPKARPYCPNNYTFAFQPPATATRLGWW
jgi:membrane peptidoglycan carboxypeptidase